MSFNARTAISRSLKAIALACALLAVGDVAICPLRAEAVSGALTPDAAEAMQRGLSAAQSEDWKGAIESFQQAVTAAPMAPAGLFNLALALDRAGGRNLAALVYYETYLASAPGASNAQALRGRIEVLDTHISETVRQIGDAVIEASWALPDDALSNVGISARVAQIHFRRKDEEALRDLIARLEPDSKEFVAPYLAELIVRDGRTEEAHALCEEIKNEVTWKIGDLVGGYAGFCRQAMVEAQLDRNDLVGALASAEREEDAGVRARLYLTIAEKNAETESRAQSLEALALARGADPGIATGLDYTTLLSRLGKSADARQVIAQMRSKLEMDGITDEEVSELIDVGKAFAIADDIDTARQVLHQVEGMGQAYDSQLSGLFEEIARAELRRGDRGAARAMTVKISHWPRAELLRDIAVAEARDGNAAAAEAAIAEIAETRIGHEARSRVLAVQGDRRLAAAYAWLALATEVAADSAVTDLKALFERVRQQSDLGINYLAIASNNAALYVDRIRETRRAWNQR